MKMEFTIEELNVLRDTLVNCPGDKYDYDHNQTGTLIHKIASMKDIISKRKETLKELQCGEWTQILPFSIEGRVVSSNVDSINVAGHKQKFPRIHIRRLHQTCQTNWKSFQDKKVRVTIEVFKK